MISLSSYQVERQHGMNREHGRYAKVNPCQLCGKSAGVDYWSWEHNGKYGYGSQLCARCAKKLDAMPEDAALNALKGQM